MLPIALNTGKLNILICGQGANFEKRCAQLKELNSTLNITRTPTECDLKAADIVFIAGLSVDESSKIRIIAKEFGCLVNAEDINDLCDFYMTSIVRRGSLVLSVSTGGKSPSLSKIIRRFLENLFPQVWEDRLNHIASIREKMRQDGAKASEIDEKTKSIVKDGKFLCQKCTN